MGETYFECAQREVLEETGLKVRAVKLVAVTNDIFSETHHYITIFILCQREDPDQEPKVSREWCAYLRETDHRLAHSLAHGENVANVLVRPSSHISARAGLGKIGKM